MPPRLFKIITILKLATLGFLLVCCETRGSGNIECLSAIPELNDAAEAYNQDPSTENCDRYKLALQIYINNGCAGVDQSAYAELDGLPCN